MRLVCLACVVVLAAVTTRSAAADGLYLSESFGGTDVKDELSQHIGSAFRVRLAAGYRRKNLAVELWFAGQLNTDGYHHDSVPTYGGESPSYDITTPDGARPTSVSAPPSSTELITYGVDLKLLQPIAPHLEVYLRGSMSKGHADGLDASGRGLGVGAGAQLKGKVPVIGFLFWPLFFTGVGPKVTAAVYVETGYEFYRLHGPRGSTDGQLNHLMLGFAVGSDF